MEDNVKFLIAERIVKNLSENYKEIAELNQTDLTYAVFYQLEEEDIE